MERRWQRRRKAKILHSELFHGRETVEKIFLVSSFQIYERGEKSKCYISQLYLSGDAVPLLTCLIHTCTVSFSFFLIFFYFFILFF